MTNLNKIVRFQTRAHTEEEIISKLLVKFKVGGENIQQWLIGPERLPNEVRGTKNDNNSTKFIHI